MSEKMLIVDDEADFATGLVRMLRAGFPQLEAQVCTSSREALGAMDQLEPTVLLTDLRMPEMDGLELMQHALGRDPNLTVVLLTAHGSIEAAVSALRGGAYEFLTKPIKRDDLYRCVSRCLERSRLMHENSRLRSLMSKSELQRTLIGDTPCMRRLKDTISAVAASDYTVLIRGESGTGKERVASSIHALSDRAKGPLMTVNCPAIPDQLLESELFGHVKGAFTGADKAYKGIFQAASGGVIVLDEIGDISMNIQTKLLRVLQDRQVRPVGSSTSQKADVRVIASTNRPLEQKIRAGEFREDLFYRLNVLTIATPPLRERADDIPLLADHFLSVCCEEMRLPPKRFSPEATVCLCSRPWPGNVRELQNFIRRLAVFCPGELVEPFHLRFVDGQDEYATCSAEVPLVPYKDAKNLVVEDFTRRYVERLLDGTRGNISEAARVSGLERVSLQKILRRLGIGPADR
ncbi:MAG: sigma-54 dependent transcriptional regulator [Desulfomicrobium sp.]|nr:sigma-54 dependent transcriptional regulator [Pseudomonadota bacterium]MBV1710493.1 sigma-54 dependent transcriptional regulator [Desulfomicrobium sp.]MBU4570101.1 sigma-54 dependent transcriptional regulator [Pseudomonadota bacterium]MBU4593020.1 sigma-54 dependent transcriptional regulator [Pseudomonadota bacterium]MBV1720831.1 sigma-54 dependent transcriptional regulator [Desulfomicrobium sp.]